jgi:hypothetical protein
VIVIVLLIQVDDLTRNAAIPHVCHTYPAAIFCPSQKVNRAWGEFHGPDGTQRVPRSRRCEAADQRYYVRLSYTTGLENGYGAVLSTNRQVSASTREAGCEAASVIRPVFLTLTCEVDFIARFPLVGTFPFGHLRAQYFGRASLLVNVQIGVIAYGDQKPSIRGTHRAVDAVGIFDISQKFLISQADNGD